MSLNPQLEKTLKLDESYFRTTKLPIVTVSASYREDLKGLHGFSANETDPDVVFSRAHYSMALAIAIEAWGTKIDHREAWVVDPTNYVTNEQWRSITLTEIIGKTIARHSILKTLKDFVDTFARAKLPILKSITPPLLHLTVETTTPILSLHIAAGNILAAQGKKVLQVITDPHVRFEYVTNAELPNVKYCVFDEKTKTEFLEKAAILGKKVDPDKVIVTGPPIDPRIIATRTRKQAWRSDELKLCLTTGGLGTNKHEIRQILLELLPLLHKRPCPINLCLYAGTQRDILTMAKTLAKEAGVKTTVISDMAKGQFFSRKKNPKLEESKFSIIYHPQIVDANEILVKNAFAWADGFITKPSGDMAYDAAAAGCFILTLAEWGEWEENVRETFESLEISRKAEIGHLEQQLMALTSAGSAGQSWIEKAMNKALTLKPLFLNGARNIVKAHQNF